MHISSQRFLAPAQAPAVAARPETPNGLEYREGPRSLRRDLDFVQVMPAP